MTTALITGISGQDGGYLAELLLAQGVTVHGLARDGDGPVGGQDGDTEGLIVHRGDLTSNAFTAGLIAEIAPDEIYNLAGISSVGQSWSEPVATGKVSGLAVAALLQAAWDLQDRTGREIRFVQASSAEIFGEPAELPQDELTRISPVNPYGAAKAFGHHLVGVYRKRGLHAVSAILYNHESPRRPASFVTRKITQGAASIAQGLSSELVLGNLDAIRDWGWAPDYVRALVASARHSEPGDYVIATGQPHTVGDFVEAAFLHAGVDDWRRYVRSDPAYFRPADATALVGDASRARDLLGWEPTVTFDEVVARMVQADLNNEPG